MYNNGDIAWTLTCAALVWLMIPGLGYICVRLARHPHVTLTLQQWFFWGYSLAFSETWSAYIGDLSLKGVLDTPAMGSGRLPALVFSLYQLMFAAATPTIALGALAERGRLAPVPIFIFVWSTLVYDPVVCWT
ncbi:Rh-like protein/ammonium transporter [Armillaria gallica]|uniref:Rh-like protein/ammonium transporter n=1 Tax=Armillaria gallica TaxID=47427 RepID=A0A2H3CTN8_ARMGA|nr:Rh-like protein/ammonium transporter [Armillaria gallica]